MSTNFYEVINKDYDFITPLIEQIILNISKENNILIFVGEGYKAKFGIESAIKLLIQGFRVKVYLVSVLNIDDFLIKLIAEFQKLNGSVTNQEPNNFDEFDVLIDAISDLEFNNKPLIKKINKSKKLIIAINSPTGLNPFDGSISESVIYANITLTLINDKPGFHTGDAIDIAGNIKVIPIENCRIEQTNIVINSILEINYQRLIRKKVNTNKGDFGTVAIIGGGGALFLAGRAAILMGAGKVVLAGIEDNLTIDFFYPELIITSINDIFENINNYKVILIGPGLSQSEKALTILINFLNLSFQGTVIFDADSLNLIARDKSLYNVFYNLKNKIITPHPKEAAKLLNKDLNYIQRNRLKVAKYLNSYFNAYVLLKGAGSIICNKELIFLNKSGNAALSSAGEGDVLGGLISSFIAQGLNDFEALKFAVFLHGLAADDIVIYKGYNGILASEITKNCRKLLNNILYL